MKVMKSKPVAVMIPTDGRNAYFKDQDGKFHTVKNLQTADKLAKFVDKHKFEMFEGKLYTLSNMS
jgi:hypothetical protein